MLDKLQMINDELSKMVEETIDKKLSDELKIDDRVSEESRKLIMNSRYLHTLINVRI